MKEIMVATNNEHKVLEFKQMLEPLGYLVKSLSDIDDNLDIEETGATFEENAIIKAKAIYDILHIPVIADDSGFMVNAMDGAPGVYSARFLGHDSDYHIKNAYIIKQVEEAKDRGCQFVSVIAYINKGGNVHTFEGIVEGSVAYEELGNNGFGYDPIFHYEPYQTTLANVSSERKNKVSHRSIALQKVLAFMKEEEECFI